MNVKEIKQWLSEEFPGISIDRGNDLYHPVNGMVELYKLDYNGHEGYFHVINGKVNVTLKGNDITDEFGIKAMLNLILKGIG